MRKISILSLNCLASITMLAQTPGINLSYIDSTVSPRNDIYNFACGKWLKTQQIPASDGPVGLPHFCRTFHGPYGWAALHPQHILETFDDAEVAGGEHIRPVKTEHQEHLGGPAAEALDRNDGLNHLVVGEGLQVREVQAPVDDTLGQITQIRGLLAAETRRSEVRDRNREQRLRGKSGHQRQHPGPNRGGGFGGELLRDDGADQGVKGVPVGKIRALSAGPLDHVGQTRVGSHQVPSRCFEHLSGVSFAYGCTGLHTRRTGGGAFDCRHAGSEPIAAY